MHSVLKEISLHVPLGGSGTGSMLVFLVKRLYLKDLVTFQSLRAKLDTILQKHHVLDNIHWNQQGYWRDGRDTD